MKSTTRLAHSPNLSNLPDDLGAFVQSYLRENSRYCTVQERIDIRKKLEGKEHDVEARKMIKTEYNLSGAGLCGILGPRSRENDAKRTEREMNTSMFRPNVKNKQRLELDSELVAFIDAISSHPEIYGLPVTEELIIEKAEEIAGSKHLPLFQDGTSSHQTFLENFTKKYEIKYTVLHGESASYPR